MTSPEHIEKDLTSMFSDPVDPHFVGVIIYQLPLKEDEVVTNSHRLWVASSDIDLRRYSSGYTKVPYTARPSEKWNDAMALCFAPTMDVALSYVIKETK